MSGYSLIVSSGVFVWCKTALCGVFICALMPVKKKALKKIQEALCLILTTEGPNKGNFLCQEGYFFYCRRRKPFYFKLLEK